MWNAPCISQEIVAMPSNVWAYITISCDPLLRDDGFSSVIREEVKEIIDRKKKGSRALADFEDQMNEVLFKCVFFIWLLLYCTNSVFLYLAYIKHRYLLFIELEEGAGEEQREVTRWRWQREGEERGMLPVLSMSNILIQTFVLKYPPLTPDLCFVFRKRRKRRERKKRERNPTGWGKRSPMCCWRLLVCILR